NAASVPSRNRTNSSHSSRFVRLLRSTSSSDSCTSRARRMKAGGPCRPINCCRTCSSFSSLGTVSLIPLPLTAGRRLAPRLDRRRGRPPQPPSPLLHLRVRLVVLVLDVADDLLQDVLQRDQAEHLLLLVADDRHRPPRPPEQLQRVAQILVRPQEQRRVHR